MSVSEGQPAPTDAVASAYEDGLHDAWVKVRELEVVLAREREATEGAEGTSRTWRRRAEAAEGRVRELEEALERGWLFERAYQESLGAVWTAPQQERLESLQTAFMESYLEVLRGGRAA